VEAALRLGHWGQVLAHGARDDPRRLTRGHELLLQLLHDKQVHTVERLFRLLGLQHRGEDFGRIARGLHNLNPKVRASSRELLENLIRPPLREAVLSLVDDAPETLRAVSVEGYYVAEDLEYEGLLATLLEQPGETLRCLAAYHVGELGLRALRPRIETLRSQETRLFVGRIFERTLRQLAGAGAEGLVHAL
jgi:hypothetical protein